VNLLAGAEDQSLEALAAFLALIFIDRHGLTSSIYTEKIGPRAGLVKPLPDRV